jgi:hypothetical protein
LFSLTAALNPTLLTATTVMLLLDNPRRLMLGYLAGAMTTGIVLGVAIVEWLSGSFDKTSQHSVSPWIDVALGVLALVVAYVVQSGRAARAKASRDLKHSSKPKKTPRWQEVLSQGSARTTFVIGILLSFPGASYLAALAGISDQHFSTVEVVLTVIGVNIIMLVLLEVPIIGFFLAPEATPRAVERFKAWLGRNGAKAAVIALTVIGFALVLKGVLEIVTT